MVHPIIYIHTFRFFFCADNQPSSNLPYPWFLKFFFFYMISYLHWSFSVSFFLIWVIKRLSSPNWKLYKMSRISLQSKFWSWSCERSDVRADVDLGGKPFFPSQNQLTDRRESAGKLEHLPVYGWGGAWMNDFNWINRKKSDYSWMHREMSGHSLIPFHSTR